VATQGTLYGEINITNKNAEVSNGDATDCSCQGDCGCIFFSGSKFNHIIAKEGIVHNGDTGKLQKGSTFVKIDCPGDGMTRVKNGRFQNSKEQEEWFDRQRKLKMAVEEEVRKRKEQEEMVAKAMAEMTPEMIARLVEGGVRGTDKAEWS
jgi:hypothetical protein